MALRWALIHWKRIGRYISPRRHQLTIKPSLPAGISIQAARTPGRAVEAEVRAAARARTAAIGRAAKRARTLKLAILPRRVIPAGARTSSEAEPAQRLEERTQ